MLCCIRMHLHQAGKWARLSAGCRVDGKKESKYISVIVKSVFYLLLQDVSTTSIKRYMRLFFWISHFVYITLCYAWYSECTNIRHKSRLIALTRDSASLFQPFIPPSSVLVLIMSASSPLQCSAPSLVMVPIVASIPVCISPLSSSLWPWYKL